MNIDDFACWFIDWTPFDNTRAGDLLSMSGSDKHVILRLTSDEALVLFDWLHRCEDEDQVVPPEHHGEQVALWNLSALLESELVEPFQENYRELVHQARVRLAGDNPDPDRTHK